MQYTIYIVPSLHMLRISCLYLVIRYSMTSYGQGHCTNGYVRGWDGLGTYTFFSIVLLNANNLKKGLRKHVQQIESS